MHLRTPNRHRFSIGSIQSKSKSTNNINSQKQSSNRSPANLKVIQIPAISNFLEIQKLKLSKQAIDKIKQSLLLDHQAQANFNKKMKNNSLYVDYNYNPFSIKQKSISPIQRTRRDDSKRVNNLIQEVNKLRVKTEFESMMNRVGRIEPRSKQLQNIFKKAVDKQKIHINKKIKQQKEVKMEQKSASEKAKKNQNNYLQEFDRVLAIRQQNFYHRENKLRKVNIFHILKEDNQDIFVSNKILKTVYFCQDSTISKSNGKNIVNIFKDISYLSRLFILNKHKQIHNDYRITIADLTLQTETLHFSDIMMVSAGCLQPSVVQSYLFEEGRFGKGGNDDGVSSSLKQDQQIYYKENEVHESCNFVLQKHDKAEIETYIHHDLSKNQERQRELSQFYMFKIKELLKIQQNCRTNSIQDKILIKDIEQKKNSLLIQQIDALLRRQSSSVDKKIRQNKVFKDRMENIKNQSVIQTLVLKKKMEVGMRSKSKNHHSSVWK